jgi:gas vesicle protein
MNKNKVIIGLLIAVGVMVVLILYPNKEVKEKEVIVKETKIDNTTLKEEYSTNKEEITEVESTEETTENPEYTQPTHQLPVVEFDLSVFEPQDQFAIADVVGYRAEQLGYTDMDKVIIYDVKLKGTTIIIYFEVDGNKYEETRTYPQFNPIK